MVDRNNLNRIKGILSARKGAEIPKFQNPASPLLWNGSGSDEIKYHKKKGNYSIYSNDGINWFQDIGLAIPHPNNDTTGFIDVNQLEVRPPLEIPGANPSEGNPTAAVTSAAESNQQVEAATQQKVADAVASQVVTREPMSELPEVNTPLNMPTGASVQNPNGLAGVESNSTGMNLTKDQLANAAKKSEQLKKAQGWEIAGQAVSGVFNAVGNAAGAKQAATDSNLTKGIDAGYDAVAGIAENLGPVGKIVGTAMKTAAVAGDLIQEMGGGTDQQTKMDKWMDSSFFSWNIGMLNGFAGKNSDSFGVDQNTVAQVGSSYGGTVDEMNDAASKAGKKYGLFSSKARKKANAAIADAKTKQNLMGDIADTAADQRLAVQSMGEQAGLAYSIMTDGGYNQKYTYAAKHGGMLEWNPVETLEWEPQIELNWELPTFKEGGNIEISEELEWIPEFKDGGKTKDSNIPEIEETTQKNVIPEGALHKNKHHMEHAEGLTKKGIPVIDEDGEQQAEIEHSEIIFTLEVTKKLEEYYDIFYSEESSNKDKDQAAIDAGKLLVYQILENTEDRTGLIDSCKQGGSLTLKKSTDALIEEALEWMPTIVVIEEEPKKEMKKKSDKEQLKEALKEVLIELLTK